MKPEHIKVREVGENPAAEVITDAIATVDRAEEAGDDRCHRLRPSNRRRDVASENAAC